MDRLSNNQMNCQNFVLDAFVPGSGAEREVRSPWTGQVIGR